MANVLPEKARREIWNFYRARFVLVGTLVFIVCGVVSLCALVPAYVTTEAGLEAFTGATTASTPGTIDKTGHADIQRAQALLTQLASAVSSTTPQVDAVFAALGARPAGITISGIRYDRAVPPASASVILLEGMAGSRNDIDTYSSALRADKRFTSVTVPLGDLAGNADGHFTITLTGAF